MNYKLAQLCLKVIEDIYLRVKSSHVNYDKFTLNIANEAMLEIFTDVHLRALYLAKNKKLNIQDHNCLTTRGDALWSMYETAYPVKIPCEEIK